MMNKNTFIILIIFLILKMNMNNGNNSMSHQHGPPPPSTQSYFSRFMNSTKDAANKVMSKEWRDQNINKHYVMMGFGVVFLLISLIAFMMISGVQTGSSDNGSSGSTVQASTGGSEDGEINPTTEVVAEFLAILFLVIGMFLLVRAWTLSNASSKLIEGGDALGAWILNGGKNSSPEVKKDLETAMLNQIAQNNSDLITKTIIEPVVRNLVNHERLVVQNTKRQDQEEFERKKNNENMMRKNMMGGKNMTSGEESN